ncbi:MAG: hypothetical protein ABJE10_10545 [bacterium]
MRVLLVSVVLIVTLRGDAFAQRSAAPSAPSAFVVKENPRAAKREAEKLRKQLDFLPASSVSFDFPSRAKIVGTTLLTSADEQTNFQLIRRAASSKPEVHARWDDLMIVRSGTGVVLTGDSLVGSSYRAPGERAGGSFVNSHEIVVHTGDMIRIPAAVPHAVLVSSTQPLEYVLIKQRRQELPIRWYSSR